jgi:hypothetical protein
VRAALLGFTIVAGAWLATLGACGRTGPLIDDGFAYAAAAGEPNETGGSRTGGSSNGGSFTGGSSSGASSSGGSSAAPGSGGTTVDDGGATFSGGTGGNVAAGGSEPAGGAFADGGTSTVGGTSSTGGVGADGGSSMGGSSPMTGVTGNETGGSGGDSMMTGGSGGTGGMMTIPPGFIRCGDTACDAATSVCCQRRNSPSTCEVPGTTCMGATLLCSGAGSCAEGETCCYHALVSSCQTRCDVSVGSPGNPPTIVLCDSADECEEDQTCVVAPRGIAYCGDNL